jgi:uncharacterized tellurite resistance protein B-like protein
MGSRTFVGCVPCVRLNIYKEVGKSLALGWFSLTAVFVNPVLILYNTAQGLFVFKNPERVRQKLREAGIPDRPEPMSILKVGYMLAASMVAADGQILAEEVAVAEQIGARLFSDFNSADFRQVVARHKSLPAVEELAGLLREALTEEGKSLMSRYLQAIASADGSISPKEQALLARVQSRWSQFQIQNRGR